MQTFLLQFIHAIIPVLKSIILMKSKSRKQFNPLSLISDDIVSDNVSGETEQLVCVDITVHNVAGKTGYQVRYHLSTLKWIPAWIKEQAIEIFFNNLWHTLHLSRFINMRHSYCRRSNSTLELSDLLYVSWPYMLLFISRVLRGPISPPRGDPSMSSRISQDFLSGTKNCRRTKTKFEKASSDHDAWLRKYVKFYSVIHNH